MANLATKKNAYNCKGTKRLQSRFEGMTLSVSPGGTAIAIWGNWFLIHSCPFSSLPKEKGRGSKGRAIYRAVSGQVIYTTLCGPCRIRSARNAIYNLYSYRQKSY